MLEQILTSDIFQCVFSGIGCTILGVVINGKYTNYKNRIQKIKCYYLEDEVLLQIPMKDENDIIRNNIHCKKFKITNTTNRDFDSLKIIFQFDPSAEILECWSISKEGWNAQKIKPSLIDKNQADANIKSFNRGDSIEYTFKVANISDNKYYITENKSLGVKIECKDKRERRKLKSKKSDKLLVNRH